MTNTGPPTDNAFDAQAYWRDRHSELSGLLATGTLGAPLPWQQWMYRGKLRIYLKALREQEFALDGANILNFGCGTGFFEEIWEAMGARPVTGVDVVPSVVDELRLRHPNRVYLCANVGQDPHCMDALPMFDLITAFDVLYHVIDDLEIENVIGGLVEHMTEDGLFMFTDALLDNRTTVHVRFRSEHAWRRLMSRHGLEIADIVPVFVAQNRPGIWSRVAPRISGAFAYWLDILLTSIAPRMANNFLIVCKRN